MISTGIPEQEIAVASETLEEVDADVVGWLNAFGCIGTDVIPDGLRIGLGMIAVYRVLPPDDVPSVPLLYGLRARKD